MKNRKLSIFFIILLSAILVGSISYYMIKSNEEIERYKQNNAEENTSVDDPSTSQPETSTEKEKTNNGQIICIGDSLTYGTEGVKSYPEYLAEKLNKDIVTFGGSQDTSLDIAARTGGYEIFTRNITVPATGSVNLNIYNTNGVLITPFKNAGSSYNPVTINGVEGTLEYLEGDTYKFTRTTDGEESVVSSSTKINITSSITFDPEKDIVIIMNGSYDEYYQDSIFSTLNRQFETLKMFNTERYLITGLTDKTKFSLIIDLNRILLTNHGEIHFVDIYSHLLNNGLALSNLTPTDQDNIDLANGIIPSSLRVDGLNGTSNYNKIIADQLIQRLLDNGYISENDILVSE